MKELLGITFIACVILIQNRDCTALEPQVKVIDTQVRYLNEKYVNALNYTITKRNATHNIVSMHWDIKEDLPSDSKLLSKVYVTDSAYNNAHLLLIIEVPICQQNVHPNLLPEVLKFGETQSNICIKKGVYDFDETDELRFEHLIPNLQKHGDYYKVEYKIRTPFETILEVTYYTEWGYLRDN